MASKPKTSPSIDDDAAYVVTLRKRVELADGVILLPRARTRVSGAVLKQIIEDCDDYRPAPAS